MDIAKQVFEEKAEGWQRGLYEDIKQTWQTPVVNWIFRTLMANQPDFLRYAWGQVKPVCMNQDFLDLENLYHRALVVPLIDQFGLKPIIGKQNSGVKKELMEQLTAFAQVAPALEVWFEIILRGLHERPMGQSFDGSLASTAPAKRRGRKGLAPRILSPENFPPELNTLCAEVSHAHGMEGKLATIHLCLAQWPDFFQEAWEAIRPILGSDIYVQAKVESRRKIIEFVDRIPYQPQLTPKTLARIGVKAVDIEDLKETFDYFVSAGPASEVVPTLGLYAYLGGVPLG